MDKSQAVILGVVFALIVAAVVFYNSGSENHLQIARVVCQLKCQNLSSSSSIPDQTCIAKNISYGYSCAVSSNLSAYVCSTSNTIYLNQNCQLS